MANTQQNSPAATRFSSKLGRFLKIYIVLLVCLYLALFALHAADIARYFGHTWIFAPIGILGAIIANSTGTGGGVVFVPAFNTLSGASEMDMIPLEIAIQPVNTIAISFLIQCFGMSVGSAVWLHRFYAGGKSNPADRIAGDSFLNIIFTVLSTTVPALLVTQIALFGDVSGKALLTAFKWFSLVLGIVLLVFAWALQHVRPHRFSPTYTDTHWLLALGAIGGVITAFFSVGVGELIAVYLILRKYPTVAAIAIAVIVSAITVIAGVGYHVIEGNIIWPVGLMAIPGAMLGGFIARLFATWLGPLWLKTVASVWIIASSAFLIIGPYLGWLPS